MNRLMRKTFLLVALALFGLAPPLRAEGIPATGSLDGLVAEADAQHGHPPGEGHRAVRARAHARAGLRQPVRAGVLELVQVDAS